MDPETYGHRRLAAAIVARAALDAKSGNGHSAGARLWLVSSAWCAFLLDSLGRDQGQVTAWVNELDPMQQAALL